ncbi:sulfite exporter TauE/SafE family protein [Marinobacterium rhizophilum]|uniref:sulfite exporter TauE/SafE family protein n=1 Tax=Marinobacterium rhizophilum TaxID=420402 RepID=UPI0003812B4E|nr:sulfite exporter TauE/SafE family protein [Marinobacterium rhizophilum]
MSDIAHTFSLQLVMLLAFTFVAAGFVKGLCGFGMPLIAIPVATLLTAVPVTTAMGWSMGAIVATNVVQVLLGRRHLHVIRRLWPLFGAMLLSMLVSVQLLAYFSSQVLSMLVGMMILVTVLSQLLRPRQVSPRWQPAFLGASGLISGVLGGMTSFFGFPAVQALLAMELEKGEFVFAISLMFLSGSLIIGSALGSHGLMSSDDLMISFSCVLPALIGLWLGRFGRERLSVAAFQRIVQVVLLGTGSSMVLSGWMH